MVFAPGLLLQILRDSLQAHTLFSLQKLLLYQPSAMSSLKPASLWLMMAFATGQTIGFQLPDVLVKDIVIIGGGASGAYASVRLRDDFGKSVAIVEMQDRLVSKATQQRRIES